VKRAAAGIALAAVLLARSAGAEEPISRAEPIVVLIYGATDPFGARLEAELRSIGVRVVARRNQGVERAAALAGCDFQRAPENRLEADRGRVAGNQHRPFSRRRVVRRFRHGGESRDVGRVRCAPRRPDVAVSSRCFAALGGFISTCAGRR
jgi:hypothetical protein